MNGGAELLRYHTRHLVPVAGEADGNAQIWSADASSHIRRHGGAGTADAAASIRSFSEYNPDSVFSRLLLNYTGCHGETTSTGHRGGLLFSQT